jgi:predicted TIM-barrel fold metal-dependent hydrolase
MTTTHDIEVVDGQLHEFGPRSVTPVDDVNVRRRIMLEVTASAMDAVGVSAALLVPGDTLVSDLAYAEFPDRFAAIHVLDSTAPDIEDQIQNIRKHPGVLGIRVAVSYPRTGEGIVGLKAGVYDRTFAAAERYDVPLFILISGALPLAEEIIRRYPNLRLIIDHFGLHQPPISTRDDPPFKHIADLLSLAQYPNVFVKMGGAPALSTTGYPFDDVWPHLHQILESFSTERLFWASDTPRFQGLIGWDMRLDLPKAGYEGQHSYAESLALIRDTDQLSYGDKEMLLGGSIRRILDWPKPTP